MSCLIKVKTADGKLYPAIRDLENDEFVTLFPGNNRNDEDLQGPAVCVKVGEGTPYEVVG